MNKYHDDDGARVKKKQNGKFVMSCLDHQEEEEEGKFWCIEGERERAKKMFVLKKNNNK